MGFWEFLTDDRNPTRAQEDAARGAAGRMHEYRDFWDLLRHEDPETMESENETPEARRER